LSIRRDKICDDDGRRDDAGLAPLIVASTQVKYTTISSLIGDVADHHPLLPVDGQWWQTITHYCR
jgi:hypothetical protein